MQSNDRHGVLQIFARHFRNGGYTANLVTRSCELAELALVEICGPERLFYYQQSRKTQSQRDRMLMAAFDGRNQDQLADRFNITPRRVRQIIAANLNLPKESGETGETL